MKTLNVISTAVLLIISWLSPTLAQNRSVHTKSWVPENGYWVVESSLHHPKTNSFYFYNDGDCLIYSETITTKRINITRKGTLKKLKRILDDALMSWDRLNEARENGSLVKTILNIKEE